MKKMPLLPIGCSASLVTQRNWGFGLCFLYLRNVEGFRFNHKGVYRIYCELSLNMRIKPKKRLKRNKPEQLAVPENSNECWSMDFMHDQLTDGRSVRLLNVNDDFNRKARPLRWIFLFPQIVWYEISSNSLNGKVNRQQCDAITGQNTGKILMLWAAKI